MAEAAELGYPFFEKSGNTGENVDTTIKFLVKEVIKKKTLGIWNNAFERFVEDFS